MNKIKFTTPVMEITKWDAEDVIVTSLGEGGNTPNVASAGNLAQGASTKSVDYSQTFNN